MPASLISAKIRGIRSYSPLEEKTQSLDFMPLTLIVGANGTGKTTIIEALKFIVSGEEPPHSDCRRNFIHTPKQEDRRFASGDNGYAVVELTFRNSFGEICLARREISRFGSSKTAPPALSSGYKIGQSSWVYVHRQDDWNKVMPKLFGLPNQAILSNVILCHQEDNLWCMGESSSVKLIFDKIFGCEHYKREIKHIEDEIRACKKIIAIEEKSIVHLGDKVERKKTAANRIEILRNELSTILLKIKSLDATIIALNRERDTLAEKVKASEHRHIEIENLRRRVKELVDKDRIYQNTLSSLFCVKRPAPKIEKQQPLKKKPASDPTVTDLDFVIDNFGRMSKLVDELPASKELDCLRSLVDETLERIRLIKSKLTHMVDETPSPPVPEELSQDDEMFAQVEKHRREVEGNIQENRKDLEEVRAKILSLQQEMKGDTELEQAKASLSEVDEKLIKVRDGRAMKTGSKCQMDRELENLERDFVSYKDVNVKYSQCLGQLVCNRLIVDDLEKLKKCFQESITTFHELMIQRINELLRSRWRQLYQGRDIEYIELVAEEVIKGKDKKSYNYHMAMRKNEVHMRMREKSSAGQRALASIIIRMTLAELFVRDFAFIALDEPTSNLDLANVQALAKSIGVYVRKRTKKGANIQWIIITHDEQFLRALDEESSPFFYRIQMDSSDGCSRIVKISSREVSDGNLEGWKGDTISCTI